MKAILSHVLVLLFVLLGFNSQAQTDEYLSKSFDQWDLGLNFGMYWPSKYHAQFYNGSDSNVNKVSYIVGNKIYYDQIKNILNVSDTFFVRELPSNMRYTGAFKIGIYLRRTFSNYLGFSLQFDYSKLTAADKFTIEVDPDFILTEPDIRICDIWGIEERVNIDLLMSKYFKTKNPILIPFFEGGLNISSTRVKENKIRIENLEYSLVDVYLNGTGYIPNAGQTEYVVQQGGMGLGFSAAVGIKLQFSPQVSVDPGFRIYYQKIKLEGYEEYRPSFSVFVRLSLADFFSDYE